ncbi:MAG TPA: hypothetical protein VEC99_00690, partial [Clostridia bacterium]|nr:hypothetical protein [Clostridia bacterium]
TNTPVCDFRNCAVRVETDVRRGFGVAVQEGQRQFVLVDQRVIEGAETLNMFATTTNVAITYRTFEVANLGGVARFAIEGSNVLCMNLGTWVETAEPLMALSVRANGDLATNVVQVVVLDSGGLRLEPEIANLLALCRGSSVIGVPDVGSCKLVKPIAAKMKWISVKPADFRQQTRLLHSWESSKTVSERQVVEMKEELSRTAWLTKDLQQRAVSALQRLNK